VKTRPLTSYLGQSAGSPSYGPDIRRVLTEVSHTPIDRSDVPVKPVRSVWQVVQNPERLVRPYVFKDAGGLKYFVNNLIDYQEKVQHHANIEIDHLTVVVSTSTKDLNSVTELDKELASFCDEIFEDITFFEDYAEKENERSNIFYK